MLLGQLFEKVPALELETMKQETINTFLVLWLIVPQTANKHYHIRNKRKAAVIGVETI